MKRVIFVILLISVCFYGFSDDTILNKISLQPEEKGALILIGGIIWVTFCLCVFFSQESNNADLFL